MGGRGASGTGKGGGGTKLQKTTAALKSTLAKGGLPTGVKETVLNIGGIKSTFSNVMGLGMAKGILKTKGKSWDDFKQGERGTAFYQKGKAVAMFDKQNQSLTLYP